MKPLLYAFALAAASALLAAPVRAQYDEHNRVAIYITFNASHATNADRGYANDRQFFEPPTQEQYGDFWRPGIGAGLSIQIVKIGRASLAFDARGANLGVFTESVPSGGHQDVGYLTAGLQLAYLPRHTRLRPYGQFTYGEFGTFAIAADPYVDTSTCLLCAPVYTLEPSSRSATSNGYEVLAGIDYPLSPHTTFRVAEFGFAETAKGSNNLANGATKSLSVFHIDSGILFHF